MQIVMSFVAGFILGMAVFHLLPHSLIGLAYGLSFIEGGAVHELEAH